MRYLDLAALEHMDTQAFQQQYPYPWVNPAGLLTEEGYAALRQSLPAIEQLTPVFGKPRRYGQRSHDRLALEYSPNVELSPHWQAFMAELTGSHYRQFISRMLGTRAFRLRFHWHYTPASCSVSPHCDAHEKLGSHIFYFNTEDDWQAAWGGQTIVLDDGGRFAAKSAPAFEDFDSATESQAIGNYSLLFSRRGNSWHGVREISCPPGHYRKVFIVVIDEYRPFKRFAKKLKGLFKPAA
ncbi:hypothetical protein [Azomonas macrocytogenes]|uniref:Prolyl 4-hydroxylase alpha subunit Fe(2+) 2OG dioxygenase domain-containing protein n=1 Tax=Azomonas macrocytogenes TaxID=69962 RepID=A0A839T1E1_AZOMA|nr:hypothetical protein [Azomonas macrocytogenes]MBB3103212.1 hypothetical protein [Azomonas macrocytogenes]